MSYTFDEAIEVLANSDNNKLIKEGQLEYGLYRAYDVVSVLQKLKQEYAPTILLTKNQYRELKAGHTLEEKMSRIQRLADNSSEDSADAYINDDMIMRSYLHPETIKIIDEEK